jgi:apolipoprotein N-acyltransferase
LFGAGVSWVYVSLHHYGQMPAALAAAAVFLFVALLALYFAALGYVQARLRPRGGGGEAWHRLAVRPALWVLFEWWRGWFLGGFPWLQLGYSQIDTALAGYAPWLGVHGVSLACALTAASLAESLRAPRLVLSRYMPLALAIWLGGFAAGAVEWARPAVAAAAAEGGQAFSALLVQGNVALADKWRAERRREILDRYLALSEIGLGRDLIIWPEAAIPAYLDQVEETLATLRRLAREHRSDFLFGAIEREGGRYYNSAVLIGAVSGVYRKRHLVPFGEFLPLAPLLGWLLDYLHIPMSDFSPGPAHQARLVAAGQTLAVSICYEDAFGHELIEALPAATLLVNLSEDAWFGDSLAPHQRLQMARMRARETARPMLRAANTGPSAAIDHRGAILAVSPPFVPFALPVRLQPMTGATPYVRFGDLPVLALAFVLAIGGAAAAARRQNRAG